MKDKASTPNKNGTRDLKALPFTRALEPLVNKMLKLKHKNDIADKNYQQSDSPQNSLMRQKSLKIVRQLAKAASEMGNDIPIKQQ